MIENKTTFKIEVQFPYEDSQEWHNILTVSENETTIEELTRTLGRYRDLRSNNNYRLTKFEVIG